MNYENQTNGGNLCSCSKCGMDIVQFDKSKQ